MNSRVSITIKYPLFSDTPPDQWYAGRMAQALEAGLIESSTLLHSYPNRGGIVDITFTVVANLNYHPRSDSPFSLERVARVFANTLCSDTDAEIDEIHLV